jgi:hypothetical protein
LERKKTARATKTRRAATIKSVLRVRRLIITGAPAEVTGGRSGLQAPLSRNFRPAANLGPASNPGPPTSIADRNRYFTTEKVYILA